MNFLEADSQTGRQAIGRSGGLLGTKRVDIATLVSLCVASGIGQPIYVSEEAKIEVVSNPFRPSAASGIVSYRT